MCLVCSSFVPFWLSFACLFPWQKLCLCRSVEPPTELQLTCLASQTYHLSGLEQGLHAFQPVVLPSPNLAVCFLTVHSTAVQQSVGALTYRYTCHSSTLTTLSLPLGHFELLAQLCPGRPWRGGGGVDGHHMLFPKTLSGPWHVQLDTRPVRAHVAAALLAKDS